MSQKDQSTTEDKWKTFSENEEKAVPESVDNEHLLQDEVSSDALTEKVNTLENQINFYKDQAARAQAELDNNRRRMEQEVTKARKFGAEKLIADLLPVVDSLMLGMQDTAIDDPRVKSLQKGMELTLGLLRNLLEKNGVSIIDPAVGDVFDPNQHEAMSMRLDPNAKSHTILQVMQKGYALHGRVIRAAMVMVVS